jgi:dinuclear metal center YbgI/SA1388 family protein
VRTPEGTRTSVADVIELLDSWYPRHWAEEWDRVGLVLGEPATRVTRVLLVVDVVPETVEQAIGLGAELIIAHHPLLLRPVSSLAPTSYKGRIVHRLIRSGIALFTAHTNADVATPGVADTLAQRLGVIDSRPLRPSEADPSRGAGRIGRLPSPVTLAEFATFAARALPATSWGIRMAGQPQRRVETVAVCGGAGEAYLADAAAAGADLYLTADLRHHAASEYSCEDGPALLDAAHWATEQPWLAALAGQLRQAISAEMIVSDLVTDPWTVRLASGSAVPAKEPFL